MSDYANHFIRAIEAHNEDRIATLLELRNRISIQAARQASPAQVRRVIDEEHAEWTDIVMSHLRTVDEYQNRNYAQAFEAQRELVKSFNHKMNNWDKRCLTPLYTVLNDLRHVAQLADGNQNWADLAMQANEEEDPEQSRYTNLKEAASAVSKSFALCINDRSPERSSKKWGVYRISGILFRIYFKINQLNLCRNVIKGIRYAVLPPLTRFPKGDQVTYAYYVGRLEFTEENFDLAEAELLKAFRLCTIRAVHNKELILQYLVPVRLLRGVLPSNELLARYPTMRETYGAIVDALRHGNVKEFSDALSASEETLLRQGTYFTVDRARTVGLRHLFRLVHKIVGSTRVPIPRFKDALQFVGVQATMEETEWELATMIYNGYIKGYLSHERLMIVLSSTDPFPFPLPALTT